MKFIQSEKLIRYIDASYNFIQNIENIKSCAKFDLSKKEKKQQYELSMNIHLHYSSKS